eukprot:UN10500
MKAVSKFKTNFNFQKYLLELLLNCKLNAFCLEMFHVVR